MTDPNHITRQQLADLIGARAPSYINELEKTGRAFRAPDGKLWLKAESLAAWRASKDPSKQGVADRHAAARAAPTQPDPPADPPAEEPAPRYSEYNYQESKAKSEHFAAAREQAAYLKEAGELVEHSKMMATFSEAGTTIRAKLESWQTTLPPQLAGRDESAIRTAIADQVEAVLTDLVEIFGRMASNTAD
jgi:hypothetical protein